MRRSVLWGGVLLLGMGALVACRDRNSLTQILEQRFFSTRADAIATPVNQSWHEPTNAAINPGRTDDIGDDAFRTFRARDGAGILAFYDASQLYLSYFDTTGPVGQPVRVRGTFQGLSTPDLDRAIVTWTPQGDAVIAFRATEEDDSSVLNDVSSARIYYTVFHRARAGVAHGSQGEEFGFETWATPIDTNVVNSDDNDVLVLFAASDLLDGTQVYGTGTTPDVVSGDAGDASADHGGHFLFLGWIHKNAVTKNRAEGRFIQLDPAATDYLQPGAIQTVSTSPAMGATEELDTTVFASGRDLVFRWRETLPSGGWADRINLVRVNATRDGLEPAIGVSRGTPSVGAQVQIDTFTSDGVIGDGYRALNGQSATWLIFAQSGFANGTTVTNTDADLLAARVDDSGNVEIGEFDHLAPTSTGSLALGLERVVLGRGASRALLLYIQRQDPTATSNTSLFARAIYLDGSLSGANWANAISDEARVNTAISSTPTSSNNAHVEKTWTYAPAPFCGPQYNNDAFYLAFRQRLEGASKIVALHYARLEVTVPQDLSSSKVSIQADDQTVQSPLDPSWSATLADVAVAEAGSADGAVVYYGANGNHPDAKSSNPGWFAEARMLAWANKLPGATSTPPVLAPVEVSSDAAGLPAQWRTVSDARLVVTPQQPASRDYALDTDTLPTDFAHLVVLEHTDDDLTESGRTLRARTMDLRDGVSTVASGRFFPALGSDLLSVSTGNHTLGASKLWSWLKIISHGNELVAVFPESTRGRASHDGLGQVFVNTFASATRSWSDAALLSNESHLEVLSREEWVITSPGVQQGCDDALGTWVFWPKSVPDEADERQLYTVRVQGRRITALSLPPR